MSKSLIIKDLVNNNISIELVLSRLYIIACDLSNTELKDWSEKELIGY